MWASTFVCAVFSESEFQNPNYYRLTVSWWQTETPLSLWSLSGSAAMESGWQSGLGEQPGLGAQWPAEEPMCIKPFRVPAIWLRQLFPPYSTVDVEISAHQINPKRMISLKQELKLWAPSFILWRWDELENMLKWTHKHTAAAMKMWNNDVW